MITAPSGSVRLRRISSLVESVFDRTFNEFPIFAVENLSSRAEISMLKLKCRIAPWFEMTVVELYARYSKVKYQKIIDILSKCVKRLIPKTVS